MNELSLRGALRLRPELALSRAKGQARVEAFPQRPSIRPPVHPSALLLLLACTGAGAERPDGLINSALPVERPAFRVTALAASLAPDSSRTYTSPATRVDSVVYWYTRVDTLRLPDTARPAPPPPPPPPLPPLELGVPFGPFQLWKSYTTVKWGPAPFTVSIGSSDPGGIITQINSARALQQKLVTFMTGGGHGQYLSDPARPSFVCPNEGAPGCRFDLAKWKARMNRFNTAAIKAAVAAAVADGTIIGNALMDEPEHQSWGGVMTKPLLDQMAAHAKTIFPTLPMGVDFGATGYRWRTAERFRVVDWVQNQFAWWITTGNVVAWRDSVLARSALDGVTPVFGLNIRGGGIQNWPSWKAGIWSCPPTTTGGQGPYPPTCKMTPQQIRDWGQALGPHGCALLMWEYEATMFGTPEYQQSFRTLADSLRNLPRKPCRRSPSYAGGTA